LAGTPQDPDWHPEGDVFVHTCHCLDALVGLPEWQEADAESKVVFSLAVLAHDFAKPTTTHAALKNGHMRIVSPGHEEAGGPFAERFLVRINAPTAIREKVIPLVTNHLAHLQVLSDRSVRRLAKRLEPATVRELIVVIIADQYGRPPHPRTVSDNVLALQAKAEELSVACSAPQPILMGRHLIELGLSPSPQFGIILEAAYDAQLEGKFYDVAQALRWLGGEEGLALPEGTREKLLAS
jgi:tRNA nucleotidyltransferase (CCA-adding enzyme)